MRPLVSDIATDIATDIAIDITGAAALYQQVQQALFSNSEQGVWGDPSDLSTLWQDAAGTIPVTADGQQVKRIDDVSGNGNYIVEVSAGEGFIYRTDGTLHWFEVTSGSHRMWTNAAVDFSGSDEITNAIALRFEQDGVANLITSAGSANSEGEFGINIGTNNQLATVMRGSSATSEPWTLSSVLAPQKMVLTQLGKISTNRNELRADGVSVVTDPGSLGTGNLASGSRFELFINRTFTGRVYQIVVRGALTEGADLALLEQYLAEKAGQSFAYTQDSMYLEVFDGAMNVHTPLSADTYMTWRSEDYDTTGHAAGGGPGSVLKDLYYQQRSGNTFGRIHRLTDVGLNEFAMEVDDGTGQHTGHDLHGAMARRAAPVFTVDGVTQTLGTRANFSPSSTVEVLEKFECYDRTDGTTVIAHLDTTKTWTGRTLKIKQEIEFTAAIDLLTCYMFMFSLYKEFDNDDALDDVITTITMPDQSDAVYVPRGDVDPAYPDEKHFKTSNTNTPDVSFDVEAQGTMAATFRSWIQGGSGSRKFYFSPAGVNNQNGNDSPIERTPLSVGIGDTFTLETWITAPVAG